MDSDQYSVKMEHVKDEKELNVIKQDRIDKWWSKMLTC